MAWSRRLFKRNGECAKMDKVFIFCSCYTSMMNILRKMLYKIRIALSQLMGGDSPTCYMQDDTTLIISDEEDMADYVNQVKTDKTEDLI